VPEHAQAVDRSSLGAENDWTERDWTAAVGEGEAQFRRGEIALGADKHGHVRGTAMIGLELRERLLDGFRACLQRPHEKQSGRSRLLEKRLRTHRSGDGRKPVLPALLARLARDGLPFFALRFRLDGIELHDGAFGEKRRDRVRAEFHGLLDDEVHVLPLRNGLRERDPAGERWRAGPMQNAKPGLALVGGFDLRGGLVATAIEKNDPVAGSVAQHAEAVVGLGSRESRRIREKLVGGDKKPMHRGRLDASDGLRKRERERAAGLANPAAGTYWFPMRLLLLNALLAGFVATAAAADFSKYNTDSEVQVSAEGERIVVEWPSREGETAAMEIDLDGTNPLIRSMSLTKDGRTSVVLEKVNPVTTLTVGSRDLTRKQGWLAFFDNPPLRPHETFLVELKPGDARVWSEGNRVVVSVGGTSAGLFSGDFRFTFYPGSPFVRAETVMSTEEDARAILYDAGLAAKDPSWKSTTWVDNNDVFCELPVDPERKAAPIAARYRTIAAQSDSGSVAVFPAPHQYFYPLDFADNFRFTWCGANYRNLVPGFGFGIRQPPEGDKRYVPWFNAPPNTQQRLAVFYLLSAGNGHQVIDDVARYTHRDSYKPIDGYLTFTSHYHIEHVHELIEKRRDQNTDGIPEDMVDPGFVRTFKRLGVNIVHPGEFHFGDTPQWDLERRLLYLRTLHEECARLSDDKILILPGEEPNVHLGGHWMSFFPKPVYWVLNRPEGEPFEQEVPGFGTVYRVGSADDVLKLMEKENGLMWTAHARLKGSTGFPDDYKETPFFKSPHFFGAAWKAMPADLSRDTLGWRVLDLLSDMNNWGYRKHVIGEVDVFRFDPDYETWAHMNINYIELDELPKFEDGWAPVLDCMREGRYFVTTGEILLPRVTIGGARSGGVAKPNHRSAVKVEAQVEWTFPLAFAEVVSGDGEKVYRDRIPLNDTKEFGSRTIEAEVDLTGRKWARLEVWDIAANGAFTMPVWFEE
jgi:hypothetical protein